VSHPIHYHGENRRHYLTANIYRRARIFDSDRFKLKLAQTLGDLRAELGFRIIGYVPMPEHIAREKQQTRDRRTTHRVQLANGRRTARSS